MAIPISNNVTTLILIWSCFFSLPLVNSLWDFEFWCSRTPYPATCNYHSINHGLQNPALKPVSHFRKIALELALEQAIQTWEKATKSGIRFRNKKEKGAWNDCVQLLDDTIFHLNRTFCPEIKDVDVQSLLNAALTNLQVCRDGFNLRT
ncbi:Pectinesterase inhibitor domain [Dillenia turbinata]|uniref:Pectinesterase inhibitor domain n=1 Tax=Dillenia turbinata TaxID=194707 RepID=A0AAN8ZJB5_9MAGN